MEHLARLMAVGILHPLSESDACRGRGRVEVSA